MDYPSTCIGIVPSSVFFQFKVSNSMFTIICAFYTSTSLASANIFRKASFQRIGCLSAGSPSCGSGPGGIEACTPA